MFCAPSQNIQHLEKIAYASYSKLLKELKNCIKGLSGPADFELCIKTVENDVLINYSKTI